MTMGEFGPRAAEVRAALGPDPSAGRIVPTQVQDGRSSRAEKVADKQNKGFSGTPIWKLQEKIKKSIEDAAVRAAKTPVEDQVPDGFVKYQGDLYWSEKRQCFWERGVGKLVVLDPFTGELADLCEEGAPVDITAISNAACQDGPKHLRHVVIRDLCKASQALRMPIHHLDRPSSLMALYRGRDGMACADFCARHTHEKLLKQLSAYRAHWANEHLVAMLREAFIAINAEYLEKHATSQETCAAVVALLLGDRLAVATVGGLVPVLCTRDRRASEVTATTVDGSGIEAGRCCYFGRGPAVLAGGDAACASAAATPEVRVVQLAPEHLGLALLSRTALAALGGVAAVAACLQRHGGRSRLAARALVEATDKESGEAAIVLMLDFQDGSATASTASTGAGTSKSSGGLPPAKRLKAAAELTQVRVRHILLKHRDCKNRIDKVRGGKLVTRSRAEAERILAKVLEECEADPKRRSALFGQRCRELSECTTCLRGGNLAGDLAWVARGKMGANFDEVAFALPVGHLSDLVETDAGTHLLLRTA